MLRYMGSSDVSTLRFLLLTCDPLSCMCFRRKRLFQVVGSILKVRVYPCIFIISPKSPCVYTRSCQFHVPLLKFFATTQLKTYNCSSSTRPLNLPTNNPFEAVSRYHHLVTSLHPQQTAATLKSSLQHPQQLQR
jgi:hypothetical protein